MIAPLNRCLIVEENFLIRQDLADMLLSLGFRDVVEAATNAQALVLLAAAPCQVAFIYFIHADDGSEVVATALKTKNIPFIVTMAYHDPALLPPVMRDAPVVSKPYVMEAIGAILQSLIEPA
jgi:AmiR/NasT family two-component response regulator